MFWQLINSFFKIVLFFVVSQTGLIKRGSSLFCKEMNLKMEPPAYEQILLNYINKTFRATNVIDWEECFTNKTVETYIFLSLMNHSLNICLNYINKTVDDKDPPWTCGWN